MVPGEATHAENQDTEIIVGITAMTIQMAQTFVATAMATATATVTTIASAAMVPIGATSIIRITGGTTGIKTTIAIGITMEISRMHHKNYRNNNTQQMFRIRIPLLVQIVLTRHSQPDGPRLRLVWESPIISICVACTHRTAAQVALGLPMAGSAMMAVVEQRRSLKHEMHIHV